MDGLIVRRLYLLTKEGANMKLRSSGEDYLKAIYVLQKSKGFVRSVDVSDYMEVSKPSVSHAVKMLREGGFIVMDDDNTLHLTELGQEIAEKIYERYQYFTNHLASAGVDSAVAEEEACRMEHTISDESFQKLKGRKQNECPFADACDLIVEKSRSPDAP